MNLIREFRNELLGRNEIEFSFSSQANPGFEVVSQMIADEKKAEKDLICIKSLKGNYGLHNFFAEAFIYDSVEQKNRIEPKKKEKKK